METLKPKKVVLEHLETHHSFSAKMVEKWVCAYQQVHRCYPVQTTEMKNVSSEIPKDLTLKFRKEKRRRHNTNGWETVAENFPHAVKDTILQAHQDSKPQRQQMF